MDERNRRRAETGTDSGTGDSGLESGDSVSAKEKAMLHAQERANATKRPYLVTLDNFRVQLADSFNKKKLKEFGEEFVIVKPKKNFPKKGGRPYAAVVNDDGFKFGMDAVTPVSWQFGYSRKQVKLGRKFYNAWWLPDTPKVRAFIAENSAGWIGSLIALKAKLR